MHQPEKFYKTEKELFEKELSSVKRKLTIFSTLRLFTFLATAIGIYFFFWNVQWVILIAIAGITLFIYLVCLPVFFRKRIGAMSMNHVNS